MKRALLIVNVLLFFSLLGVFTGMMLYAVIPSSLQGTETVLEIHEWSGRCLFVLAALHLWLNRRWIISNLFPKSRKKR